MHTGWSRAIIGGVVFCLVSWIRPDYTRTIHENPSNRTNRADWWCFVDRFLWPADPQYRNESSSFKRPCVATEENLPAGSAKLSGDNSASIASRRWEKSLPPERRARRPTYP